MKQSKQLKAKEPVRIRFKKLENGNQSVYFGYLLRMVSARMIF
jgi:hypothetical protein